jgi:vacuolar-type H+-ATPase subunit E/Vma4
MKYDHLIQSMELEAGKKIQDINDRIAVERNEILEKARAEGENIRIATVKQTEKRAVIEMNKKLYEAKEKVNENVALEHESALDEVFSKARSTLDLTREEAGYPESFGRMLDEVLSGIGGEDIALHVDPRDLDLCRKLVHDRNLDVLVLPDISTAGGLNGSCCEGKIVVRNTIEDRLLQAKKLMKSTIFRALYGD